MSESLEGVRVAATRQKAGRVENREAVVAEPPAVGSVKAPAATVFADVIVAFGSLREVRLSQGAARTGDTVRPAITRTASRPIKLFGEMTGAPPFSHSFRRRRPCRPRKAKDHGMNRAVTSLTVAWSFAQPSSTLARRFGVVPAIRCR